MGTSDEDSAHVQAFWTIVTGYETDSKYASPEARLSYLNCEQNALSIIFLHISLSHTASMGSSAELWSDLKDKYDVLSEATVHALIIAYHPARMRDD